MLVLGLHEGHNASASIAIDGRIVAAVAEERFTGLKNYMGFPLHAARYCLAAAGVDGNEVGAVAMVTRDIDPLIVRLRRSTAFSPRDHLDQQTDYYTRLRDGDEEATVRQEYAATAPSHRDEVDGYDFSGFGLYRTRRDDCHRFLRTRCDAVVQHLDIPPERVRWVDHHTCHAAYAYGASVVREEPVLVFTADCVGDGSSATAWLVDGEGRHQELQRTGNQILGYVWRYAAIALGMVPLEDEQKLMGLAPYGDPGSDGSVASLASLQSVVGGAWAAPDFGHYRDVEARCRGLRFDRLCAGLQAITESCLASWMGYWVIRTGCRAAMFGGGLALNVKSNAVLARTTGLDRFLAPPGPDDQSLPVGACYHLSGPSGSWARSVPLQHAYLGPDIDPADEAWAVERCRSAGHMVIPPCAVTVAKLLAAGRTVGRCAGRLEFGPRALGNRSILAPADDRVTVDLLNKQVKRRDWWMPFAPILRAADAPALLDAATPSTGAFMTTAFATTERGRMELAAAIHPRDGSARAQVLERVVNPELDDILLAYERVAGHVGLVNTSFNLHRKPLVLGAREAVKTFLESGLDGLLLPGALVVKRGREL